MDRLKMAIAIVGGLGTVGGGVVAGMVSIAKSSASAVASPIEHRVTILEVKSDNEVDWRRWMVTQVERISRRVGAPVAPPPVIAAPDGGSTP